MDFYETKFFFKIIYAFYIALPCTTLPSPLFGSIECLRAKPVVGDSCNISCDKDYILEGSSIRDCLPSRSWSGTDTECSLIQCPTLVPAENSLIVSRCSEDLNSSCTLACESGYYLEGVSTTHVQSCSYANDGKTAIWSSPPTCIGNLCYVLTFYKCMSK